MLIKLQDLKFRLLEQREPGSLGKIEDPFGRNLLWYTLASAKDYQPGGIDSLTPVQKYLYGLCDHAKPDCAGISFDDLLAGSPEPVYEPYPLR